MAGRFTAAHAAGPDWRAAADRVLAGLEIAPGANLGFLYVSDAISAQLSEIYAHLQAGTGIAHWVGTVGVGICGSGAEYYATPALSVLAGEFPADGFRIFSGLTSDTDQVEQRHGVWLAQGQTHLGVVHGDPRNTALPALIAALPEYLPGGFLTGGITSSDGCYLQVADGLTEGGLSGALFNEQVNVAIGLTQGCAPIGPKHVITECRRNIAIRLDHRPALEVLYEDIGELLARDLSRIGGYIFAALPITGSDRGDYLVRNLLGVDTTQQLIGIGELLSEGDTLMFCRRDAASAREDLARMLDDLRQRTAGAPIQGALYHSCLGRGRDLFGEDSAELRQIRDALGDIPLAGFYANGEICHNRLYGYTGVLTLFL
jgi:small ligand-binding sensory domain FIST